MENFSKFLSALLTMLSLTGFSFGSYADQVLLLSQRSDTCIPVKYFDDNSIAFNGISSQFTFAPQLQMGNYFPINDGTSGVIKSIDMCFSSDSTTTPQTCVVYFYGKDQTTIIGQSESFINYGAPWPDTTWINVSCPDISYTGPFYAMVDYSVAAFPNKNFFTVGNEEIPYSYDGFAYTNINGNWAYADVTFGCYCSLTFLQHVNVCENNVAGITQLSPGTVSCFPNPANNQITITSRDEISSIELINYTGQTITKLIGDKMKTTNMDISKFSSGQYLVRITSRSGVVTTRLTIAH